MRLEDKVAIITGGTSGIGRRTVENSAEEGASVLIAAERITGANWLIGSATKSTF